MQLGSNFATNVFTVKYNFFAIRKNKKCKESRPAQIALHIKCKNFFPLRPDC